jgi:anti-anti-sigma regulatory factor
MSTTQLSRPPHIDRDGAPRLCLRLIGGDPAVIEIWGELAAGTGHLLTELVEHVVSGGPTAVVLDLSHARPLSAGGTRVLELALATIVAAGARVRLRGCSHRARPPDHPGQGGVVSAGTENGGT